MEFIDDLHSIIQTHNDKERAQARLERKKGELAEFSKDEYVLYAHEKHYEGKKLCLRGRGPTRVVKSLTDYVFKIEDLWTGDYEDHHGTRLEYYSGLFFEEKVMISHAPSFETGMLAARLLRLYEYSWGALRYPSQEKAVPERRHHGAYLMRKHGRAETSQEAA